MGREEEAWAVQNGINLLVNRVLVVAARLLLTKRFPSVLKLYRMSSDPPKSGVFCSQFAGRVKIRLSSSLLRERHMSSPPLSPTMNPQRPPPLIGTLLVDCWSSSSCLSLATAPIPRYDTRMVTSTPATYSLKLEPENTIFGVEKTIGLSARVVLNAIPSELALLEAII